MKFINLLPIATSLYAHNGIQCTFLAVFLLYSPVFLLSLTVTFPWKLPQLLDPAKSSLTIFVYHATVNASIIYSLKLMSIFPCTYLEMG